MSWHCPYCESSDNDAKWCKIMVGPISGGIPFTYVCHIDCLRFITTHVRVQQTTSIDNTPMKDGCQDLDEEFRILEEHADE